MYMSQPGLRAQSVVGLTADPGVTKFKSQVCHITFMDIDHEIISMAIFRWFKKGSYQLLVKVCAQVLVNYLED